MRTAAAAAVIAENGRRAMLKRLFYLGRPDIMSLLRRKDLPGLVRALQDKSPDVVRDAAEAITSLHRQGDEAERQQAAGTAPALMDAHTRVCGPGAWLLRTP
jgi:HEAT repeat protein